MRASRDSAGQRPAADRYRAFGLRIASELRLPELKPMPAGRHDMPEVSIRFGTLPAGLPGAMAHGPCFQAGKSDFLLDMPNVARYRIRGGNDIVVDPYPAGSDRNVRLFLLGTAFGVLCHQRGLLPLHANAIVVNGRAVVFAGHQGAGKSTLAAHFYARGYDVLGDDVCVVGFDAPGRPVAWPGLPRLKLWRDAAEFFGYECRTLERAVDGLEKFHVPLARAHTTRALPLARIYVLRDAAPGSPQEVSRLTGSEALDAIMSHTYRHEYLNPMGLMKSHFAQAAALLNHTHVHAAPRRRGFDRFEEEAAKLERHFLRGEGNTDPVPNGARERRAAETRVWSHG